MTTKVMIDVWHSRSGEICGEGKGSEAEAVPRMSQRCPGARERCRRRRRVAVRPKRMKVDSYEGSLEIRCESNGDGELSRKTLLGIDQRRQVGVETRGQQDDKDSEVTGLNAGAAER
jgi:hypothetical protein